MDILSIYIPAYVPLRFLAELHGLSSVRLSRRCAVLSLDQLQQIWQLLSYITINCWKTTLNRFRQSISPCFPSITIKGYFPCIRRNHHPCISYDIFTPTLSRFLYPFLFYYHYIWLWL